ncbi:right-handed parallel beta-helix repeat-containing protein, partial [Candidatus Falkowbacteria bacterium]|nr:right-handed parallel beta-helix repeat-containing protein [Candidatus Falkowbacteria bacterium]
MLTNNKKTFLFFVSLLIAFFFVAPGLANATTYYVSSSGNDSNNGTSINTPWQTLTKVSNTDLLPGDEIQFKKGDIFYGSLTIKSSGVEGNPITYGSYGSGNKPMITGFTDVTDWTNKGNNIWESTEAVSTIDTMNIVVINDANTPMGRTPNLGGYYYFNRETYNVISVSDYLSDKSLITTSENYSIKTGEKVYLNLSGDYYDGYHAITRVNDKQFYIAKVFTVTATGTAKNSSNNIKSSYLNINDNWKDAELAVNLEQWMTRRLPIINQSGDTLTFTNTKNTTILSDDIKFIIQNDIRTLDQQNEWYYNQNTKKISIYSATQPINIKVSTVAYLVNIKSKDNITIKDIEFTGSNDRAISVSMSNNITIDNCDINYGGAVGVYGSPGNWVGSDNLTISNSTFEQLNNGAISIHRLFTNTTVSNNTITNIGSIYGANTSGESGLYGIKAEGSGTTIEYNTLKNLGYSGIVWFGSNVNIRYNYVENFNRINSDGGGIYTFNTANWLTRQDWSGNKIYNNIIINDAVVREPGHHLTGEMGIYFDYATNGVECYNNTISLPLGYGIYTTAFYNMDIHNNTVYDGVYGMSFRSDKISNVSFTHNIIISKNSKQYPLWLDPTESIVSKITSDYNILDRISSSNGIVNLFIRTPSWSNPKYSLSEWQLNYGQDVNSSNLPTSLTSEDGLQLVYNNTKQAKSYNLGNSIYKDVDGNIVTNPITLQPFTSKIIIDNAYEDNDFKIGNTELYSSISTGLSRKAMPVTFNEDGIITSISVYQNGGTGNVLMGVYANQSGLPSSQLGVTPSTAVNSTAGWQTVNLINPVKVISGQTVWLAWVFQNAIGTRYETGTPGRAISEESWSGGMPSYFGSSSIANTKYSSYLNYILDNNPIVPDTTKPTVTAFTIPSTANSLTIPISSFTANDNNSVTSYMITETSASPSPASGSWTNDKPISYTFISEGTKTLYAWAKDAAGNVSSSINRQVTISLPVITYTLTINKSGTGEGIVTGAN